MRVRWLIAILGLAAACPGCGSVVESHRASAAGDEGIPYSLPRTVLEVRIEITRLTKKTGEPLEGFDVAMSLTPHQVADPRHRYVLRHNRNAFTDDDLTVGVTTSGLLDSFQGHSEDQTATALLDLSKVSSKVAQLALAGPDFGIFRAGPAGEVTELLTTAFRTHLSRVVGSHAVMFPLPDADDWTGPVMERTIEPFPGNPEWSLDLRIERLKGDPAVGNGERAPKSAGGILVRGVEPLIVQGHLRLKWKFTLPRSLRKEEEFNEALHEMARLMMLDDMGRGHDGEAVYGLDNRTINSLGAVVAVPDYSPIVEVPLDRALLVKSEWQAKLTSGSLTEMKETRPSSAAAGAKLPLDLATELVKIPTDLIQFRVNLATAETTLANTEAGRITAERALLDQQRQDLTAAEEAHRAAELARLKWQSVSGSGTPAEIEAKFAYRIAAIQANDTARRVGRPPPYSLANLP